MLALSRKLHNVTSIRPRIEQQNARRGEIGGIPGHDVQTVPPGSCRDQSVTGWDGPPSFLRRGCQFSPDAAGFKINRKQPVSIESLQFLQPTLQFVLVPAFSEERYPLSDFADRKNADKQGLVIERIHSVPDPRVTPWMAQDRKDTSIKQHSHSLVSRMEERSRARLSPSRLGPSPRRNSLKLGWVPVSFS